MLTPKALSRCTPVRKLQGPTSVLGPDDRSTHACTAASPKAPVVSPVSPSLRRCAPPPPAPPPPFSFLFVSPLFSRLLAPVFVSPLFPRLLAPAPIRRYHMKRCEDSGLWVTGSGGGRGAGEEDDEVEDYDLDEEEAAEAEAAAAAAAAAAEQAGGEGTGEASIPASPPSPTGVGSSEEA